MARETVADKEARRRVELLHEKLRRDASGSLRDYLRQVVVDCVPEPRPFGQVREPWQQKRDDALAPAVEFVAGLNPDYRGPMNFWFNYAKGHDKSSSLGRLLNWMLAFAPRKGMRLLAGAKDRDQAGVVLDAMVKEAAHNPWLQSRIDFKRDGADSKVNGSQLRVLTSDAGGVQGKTPDLIVADELTHWESRALFDSLYSGVGKRGDSSGRQRCLFVILTNAGVLGSWQDQVRALARERHGTDWHFYQQQQGRPLASWLSPAVIDSHCAILHPAEGNRLWRNIWTDPSEDRGAFNHSHVDACVGEPRQPPPGAQVYFGIDYGGVRDRTALVTCWFDGEVLHVVGCDCWQGSELREVSVADVDCWVDQKFACYPNATAVFDMHQLLGTVQRLESTGRSVKRFDYNGGKKNAAMYENMQTLIQNKRLRLSATVGTHPYDGTTLLTELKSVLVAKRAYGNRIDHDSKGHDDRVVAVGMAALEAVANSGPLPQRQLNKQPQQVTGPFRPGGGFGEREHFARRGWYDIRG